MVTFDGLKQGICQHRGVLAGLLRRVTGLLSSGLAQFTLGPLAVLGQRSKTLDQQSE